MLHRVRCRTSGATGSKERERERESRRLYSAERLVLLVELTAHSEQRQSILSCKLIEIFHSITEFGDLKKL